MRKYNFINTKELCNPTKLETYYWLGYLLADGCISKRKDYDNYLLTLSLSSKDKSALLRFKLYFKLTHPLILKTQKILKLHKKVYNPPRIFKSYKISICQKDLLVSLKKWSIIPNKTGKERLTSCISNKNFGSFLRGVFDGDGSISLQERSLSVVFTSASKIFLSQLKHSLKIWLNINSNIYKNSNKIYRLHISHLDIDKFYNLLYSDGGWCLKRKKRLFIQHFIAKNTPTKRTLNKIKSNKKIIDLIKKSYTYKQIISKLNISSTTIWRAKSDLTKGV